MKVLIVGSSGQLGSELTKFIKTGVSEIGVLPKSFKANTLLTPSSSELDIKSREKVKHYFNQNKPDLIFNCAAYTKVDDCETNEELAYNINALGPKNLAEACTQNNCRLIQISTDYVFSGEASKPYIESDITNPKTIYGKSKLAGEKFVLENCNNSCVCRTAWLYGKTGNNFVKTMLKLATDKKEISVVNDQMGNPTSTVDLAYQIVLLANSKETGIFHCTNNGDAISWFNFSQKIFELTKLNVPLKPCTTQEYPRPAKRPAYSALDNKHLRETIGDSMRNWEVALENFLKIYLSKGV